MSVRGAGAELRGPHMLYANIIFSPTGSEKIDYLVTISYLQTNTVLIVRWRMQGVTLLSLPRECREK